MISYNCDICGEKCNNEVYRMPIKSKDWIENTIVDGHGKVIDSFETSKGEEVAIIECHLCDNCTFAIGGVLKVLVDILQCKKNEIKEID